MPGTGAPGRPAEARVSGSSTRRCCTRCARRRTARRHWRVHGAGGCMCAEGLRRGEGRRTGAEPGSDPVPTVVLWLRGMA